MSYPLCQESLSALRECDRVNEIWAISMHVDAIRDHDLKVRVHFISMITLESRNSMLGRMYTSRPCTAFLIMSPLDGPSQKGLGLCI